MRLRRVLWNPWQRFWKLKFMKNQALELHSPLPKPFKVCKERSKERSKERGKTEWRKQRTSSCSLHVHFWSTYRSPFPTFYIPFQSSGSQESNASNGARFGVETKKLQPLEADHSKVLRNQPFVARISQPFCTVLWNSSWNYPIHAPRWKLSTSRWKPTSQPCEDRMLLRNYFAALFIWFVPSSGSGNGTIWSIGLLTS